MAQTTYNVTIPHTSAEVTYGSDGWNADCPVTNGQEICGDASGNVQGSHISSVSSATFTVPFYGKSIYLYGAADSGMTLTLSINYMSNPITLSPSNGVLASIDDFTTHCTDSFECTDMSIPGSTTLLDYNYNTAKVTATQYTVGAKISFVKAVYSYPTWRSGATVSLKTYQNNDTALQYSTGWTRNGTYMQSGGQLSQQLNLAFDGPAIWIWEFCGQRESFDLGDYGQYTINGRTNYAFSYDTNGLYQDGKCLVWFEGNLNNTGNTLVMTTETWNIQLHSIDVLQVSGGTVITPTTTQASYGGIGYSYTSLPTSGTSNNDGTTNGTSKAVMIAVPVVMISLAVAAGVIIALLVRRSRKRKAGAANNYTTTTTGPDVTTPEAKVTEHSLNTPPQVHGYLNYTPPPPATPMPAPGTAPTA